MNYRYRRTFKFKDSARDYQMIITPERVSIWFRDGSTIRTYFEPMKIFPGRAKLTPTEIRNIHTFLKFKNFEGEYFSKEDMDAEYEKFRHLKENDSR